MSMTANDHDSHSWEHALSQHNIRAFEDNVFVFNFDLENDKKLKITKKLSPIFGISFRLFLP